MCTKYTNKKKKTDSAIYNISILLPAARLAIKHVNGKDLNKSIAVIFTHFGPRLFHIMPKIELFNRAYFICIAVTAMRFQKSMSAFTMKENIGGAACFSVLMYHCQI